MLEIRRAGQRAVSVTRQLLALSRKQVALPRPLDLNQTVRGLETMLRLVLRDDVRLELRLSEQPVVVVIDAGQIEQVLLNLAINSRDAMPGGGEICIRTSAFDVPPRAYLEVADTGVGMDPALQSRVFEPFFTTKPAGTGLGLSTVYGIIEQAGGHVSFQSSPGHGTSFRIDLPLAGRDALPAEPAPPVLPSAMGTGRILVVDDDPQVGTFVSTVLESSGYSVLSANSPEQARSLFERDCGAIDLMITDVVMAGASGPELAAELQAHKPALPVLFVSGYPDPRRGAQLLVPGWNFLEKPFDGETVLARVRSMLTVSASPRTVLVVDDDPSIRIFLRRVLSSAGQRVIEAASGTEALRALNSSPVDVVIADLVMPDCDGLGLIREFAGRPNLAILAMSGSFDGDMLRTAEVAGAHAILAKPLVPERVLDLVRTLHATA
jgi:two-component system, cell cycle sensor histidine kinase and response regulator CckA